jgi:hypothetical protein
MQKKKSINHTLIIKKPKQNAVSAGKTKCKKLRNMTGWNV